MTKIYPQLEPLRDLRHALGQMRFADLAVGKDGRNRTSLWPFLASTGRNAPSSKKYVFGPSVWLRRLIKPGPGRATAYIDYGSQQIAIAAALSVDHFLAESITTGDPYMHFAILSGLAPEGATTATHKDTRALCKQTLLGTQYGMGARTLAFPTGKEVVEAQAMLDLLARTYPIFAEWREAEVDTALLRGYMVTNYGWTIHVTNNTKPTALKNFPVQAHGAEMLRIACCLTTAHGVQVIAPVHDALMIESSVDQIETAIKITRGAMAEAAAAVIGTGVWIDTDVNITSHPDRYRDSDDRGQAMWERVNWLLGRLSIYPTIYLACGLSIGT